MEPTSALIRVELGGVLVAESTRARRVLETSQPPAYYLPPADVDLSLLRPSPKRTFCEWKGTATYHDVAAGGRVAAAAAWSYENPAERFADIAGHLAFYAQLLDCWVDGERVTANEGTFYGGWITSTVVGPFKGGPGSAHW
jgi:uncharacterized protein (DUF427 family)